MTDTPVRAPARISIRRRAMELRAPVEYAAYVWFRPLLRMLRLGGEPHTVLVLPGGQAGDRSTAILRWEVRSQGYSAHGWGLGKNVGANEETLAGMRDLVDRLYREHDSTISVVGWSLGGIYGRMLARDRPDKIRQVITLGSPFRMVETDRFQPARRAKWERFVSEHAPELDLLKVHEHDRPPLTVPTTAIYSRNDGFAPWQLSIDETGPDAPNPRAENVEVRGTHLGLVANPAVQLVVLDRLAQREGEWRPFQPIPPMRPFYPSPATWIHPAERASKTPAGRPERYPPTSGG